ncbi:MAG: glycosyltransferase family 4 protein [Pseudomonadota bacterium]
MSVMLDPKRIMQLAQSDGWLDGLDMDFTDPKALYAFLFPPRPAHSYPSSVKFDPGAYITAYPDVADYPFHPLVHYLTHGQDEGRKAFPMYPTTWDRRQTDASIPLWVECHEASLTGAPLAALDLYQGLYQRFGRIPAYMGGPYHGPVEETWAALGSRVLGHGLSPLRMTCPKDRKDLVAQAAHLLERAAVQAVHVHSAQSYLFVLAAQHQNLPCLWTIHEPAPLDNAPDLEKDSLMTAFEGAGAVIFVSQASCTAWAPYLPKDQATDTLHILAKETPPRPPQRARARKTLGLMRRDVLIVSVGTVCDRKGQMDIVDMLDHWDAPPDPTLRFVIVGFDRSDYAMALKGRCTKLRNIGWHIDTLEHSTDWAGRSHVERLFDAADICLVTSRAESRPLVISEAFGSGCPVIATDVTGIGDMIAPGKTGALYTPGDPLTLGQIIKNWAADPATRQALRDHIIAKQRSDQFDRALDAYGPMFTRLTPQIWAFDTPHFYPV